jgi:hypothetical protein
MGRRAANPGIGQASAAACTPVSQTRGRLAGELDDALRDECRALAVAIAEGRERAERLQQLADRAREQADRDEHALRELRRSLGLDPQLSMDELDERLRGQRLQEIAVHVLADQHPEGQPVHYREWYALLRAAGYTIGGKDPIATFLASVSRAPHVQAIGRRTGLYVLTGGAQGSEAAAAA